MKDGFRKLCQGFGMSAEPNPISEKRAIEQKQKRKNVLFNLLLTNIQ